MPSLGELRIDLIADIARFVSPFATATNRMERFARDIAKSLDGVEKAMEKMGRQLSVKVSAPLAALSYAAVKAADSNGDFADSLERLSLQAKAALVPLGSSLIKAFETIRPAIEDGIRFVNGLAQAFDELDEPTKMMVIRMAAVAAATGPTLLALSTFATVGKIAAQNVALIADVAGKVLGPLANMRSLTIGAITPMLALQGVLAGIVGFELGRYLYDEFRAVQIAGNRLATFFEKRWIEVSSVFRLAVAGIGALFEDTFNVLKNRLANFFENLGSILSEQGRKIGGEWGNGLAAAGDAAVEAGERIRKAISDGRVEVEKFIPLARLAQQIYEQTRDLPAGTARSGVNRSLSLLLGEVQSGDRRVDPAVIDQAVNQMAESLEQTGEKAMMIAAETLRRRRDEIFKDVSLPFSTKYALISREFHAAKAAADAAADLMQKGVDDTFGTGQRRTGRSFIEFVKDDLKALPGLLQQAADALSGFTVGEGMVKLVDLFGRARELAKGVKLPEVVTKRDREEAEKLAKAMEDLKRRADAINAAVDPGFLLRGQALEAIDVYEKGGISFETLQARLQMLQKEFEGLRGKGKEIAKSLGEELGEGIERFSFRVSDAFADLVVEGRAAFDELGKAFLKMLVSTTLQKQVFGPLAEGFGGFVGKVFDSANALGGVFAGGQKLAFAMGGVVSGPTTFPMAGGRTGLMGEAGPEAIMPLQRVNGYLGVRATGGGTVVNIIDQRRAGERPQVTESTGPDGRKQISILIRDEVKAAIADGSLDRVMGNSYGLGRRGGRR